MIKRKQQKVILFADISGSSALYKTDGNTVAKQKIDALLNAFTQLVSDFKGKMVKTIGDEIMTYFSDCNDCLQLAILMQQKYQPIMQQNHLRLSIGIGFGDVLIDDGDLFGEAVNDAAHLTYLAKGGQILLTESLFEHLNTTNKSVVREFDRIRLKGARRKSTIYRAFWLAEEALESETQLMASEDFDELFGTLFLKIHYRGAVQSITPVDTPFILGRDPQRCHLLVSGSQVSREHCEIRYSRGKFVLVDHSTNGCYLTVGNREEFYLRREEYPLIDMAKLSLGLPAVQSGEDIIELTYE